MTDEQLEELAGGRNPSFMGMDCEDAITSLARRVLAAEKLAEAVEYDLSCWPGTMASSLRQALIAYREASK